MACLNTLKAEIRTIAEVFPKNSASRFQVIKANLDEITCRFIGTNGRKHDIHANITVNTQLIIVSYWPRVLRWHFFFLLWGNKEIKVNAALVVCSLSSATAAAAATVFIYRWAMEKATNHQPPVSIISYFCNSSQKQKNWAALIINCSDNVFIHFWLLRCTFSSYCIKMSSSQSILQYSVFNFILIGNFLRMCIKVMLCAVDSNLIILCVAPTNWLLAIRSHPSSYATHTSAALR